MNQTDLLDLKANKVPPKMVNRPMAPADLEPDLDRADLVLVALEVEWVVVRIVNP